jgi:hypothetical protein
MPFAKKARVISRFHNSYPRRFVSGLAITDRNGEQASPTAIGSSSPQDGIPSDITLAEEPEPVGLKGCRPSPRVDLCSDRREKRPYDQRSEQIRSCK